MEIDFKTQKLRKNCSNEKAMRAEWGDRMAKRLMQRLAELEAAPTLEEMRRLPGRCHELTGDLAGSVAMDLVHPQRLIFRPNHDPPPAKPDGGLDWRQVTKIVIMEVRDYH